MYERYRDYIDTILGRIRNNPDFFSGYIDSNNFIGLPDGAKYLLCSAAIGLNESLGEVIGDRISDWYISYCRDRVTDNPESLAEILPEGRFVSLDRVRRYSLCRDLVSGNHDLIDRIPREYFLGNYYFLLYKIRGFEAVDSSHRDLLISWSAVTESPNLFPLAPQRAMTCDMYL